MYTCGVLCTDSEKDCGDKVLDMVLKVTNMASALANTIGLKAGDPMNINELIQGAGAVYQGFNYEVCPAPAPAQLSQSRHSRVQKKLIQLHANRI